MMRAIFISSILAFQWIVSTASTAPAPKGCNAVPGDSDWPDKTIWARELPLAVPRSSSLFGISQPDYRVSANTIKEVQDAVKFAAKHNVRLSIINSGHDYFGRNNAPNGLWLDVSNLAGVRVHQAFQATAQGQQGPDSTGKVNIIQPKPGATAAATFGAGLSAVELNQALKASKVFAVSGAAPGVRISGGWGQTGGHGPLTSQLGLGVDQWLEFKVVDSKGNLLVANKESNPDLFWALRGGGGGTFGVVVQATVKVYPHADYPIAAYSWYIKSDTASILNAAGIGSGTDGLFDAIEHLAKDIPRLSDSGSSAYMYFLPTMLRGFVIGVGATNATAEWLKALWDPTLDKMAKFKGNKPVQRHVLHFANYQEFFDYTYLKGKTSGCYDVINSVGKVGEDKFSASKCSKSDSRKVDQSTTGRPKRSIPAPPGRFEMLDSVFLSKATLTHPNLKTSLKKQAVGYGWLMVSGNKAHRPDDDTSAHPDWRTGYVHCMTVSLQPFASAEPYRKLAPTAGSYANEGNPNATNWKQTFWGSNYPKLSQIKTKYDPNMIFWASPGINADMKHVKQGRLCNADITPPVKATVQTPPHNGNSNKANIFSSGDEMFGGLEVWVSQNTMNTEGKVIYRG